MTGSSDEAPPARDASVTPTPPSATASNNSTSNATAGASGGDSGSSNNAGGTATAGPSPLTVGTRFVKQYYKTLSTTPDQIFRFYQPSSVLSVGVGSTPTTPSTFEETQADIKDRFKPTDVQKEEGKNGISSASKSLENTLIRFDLEYGAIDAQQSVDNAILLVVTGHTVYLKQPEDGKDDDEDAGKIIARKAFVHTFFLRSASARNRVAYYVHNDVLRFLHQPSEASASFATITTAAKLPESNGSAVSNVDSTVVTSTNGATVSSSVKEESQEKSPTEIIQATTPVESSSDNDKTQSIPHSSAVGMDGDAPGGGIEESKEVMLEEVDGDTPGGDVDEDDVDDEQPTSTQETAVEIISAVEDTPIVSNGNIENIDTNDVEQSRQTVTEVKKATPALTRLETSKVSKDKNETANETDKSNPPASASVTKDVDTSRASTKTSAGANAMSKISGNSKTAVPAGKPGSWASLVKGSATGPPGTPTASLAASPPLSTTTSATTTTTPTRAVKPLASSTVPTKAVATTPAGATAEPVPSSKTVADVAIPPTSQDKSSVPVAVAGSSASVSEKNSTTSTGNIISETKPSEASTPINSNPHQHQPSHSHQGGAASGSATTTARLVGNDTNRRDPDSTLVIKNIPFHAVEKDIMGIFERFASDINGRVIRCTVNADRGIAFMDYDSPDPVLNAINVHRDKPFYLMDRKLHIYQKVVAHGGGGGNSNNYQHNNNRNNNNFQNKSSNHNNSSGSGRGYGSYNNSRNFNNGGAKSGGAIDEDNYDENDAQRGGYNSRSGGANQQQGKGYRTYYRSHDNSGGGRAGGGDRGHSGSGSGRQGGGRGGR